MRRAASLQKTADAKPPKAWMSASLLQQLGVAAGDKVTVKQGTGTAVVNAGLDNSLPANVVKLAAAHASTAPLRAMFGAISVEKFAGERA